MTKSVDRRDFLKGIGSLWAALSASPAPGRHSDTDFGRNQSAQAYNTALNRGCSGFCSILRV
jgi:hypothetical protein